MGKVTINLPVLLPTVPDTDDPCVLRLIGALENREGIYHAHVKSNGEGGSILCIHFNPEVITLQRIKNIAQSIGAQLHDTFGHLMVEVEGIRYQRRSRSITERLKKLDGVVDAYAAATGWVRIEFNRDATSKTALLKALEEMGLTVKRQQRNFKNRRPYKEDKSIGVEETEEVKESSGKDLREEEEQKDDTDHDAHDHHQGGLFGDNSELIFSLIGGGFLGIGFSLSYVTALPGWISLALYLGAYFFGGYYIVQEAYSEIMSGNFEIDFLMIVAAIGAAILGEWAEGALLLFLFSLGHSLEHYAMGRAREAIKSLAELAPKTALRKTETEETEVVPVEKLKKGDTIVIKPNSKISADGIITNGNSSVDQSPITGESVPVDKSEFNDLEQVKSNPDSIEDQHRVFAGTINGSGSIEVMVTKLARDSTLSRLVKLVNEAETQKSPTQQFTDKFEAYFVPSVLVLVVLLHFAFLIVEEPFSASFYRAMAVLVASSPCALAISTPSAVLSGVARAARGGVLIKGGRPLEDLGVLEALAFDKTGTLTEGKPKLVDVVPLNGVDEKELLAAAVAVERLSDHPLADAVVRGSLERLKGTNVPEAEDLESITGRGVKAKVGGAMVYIGNRDLFDHVGGTPLPDDLRQRVKNLEKEGKTTMTVRSGDRYLGVLSLMDTPREDASEVIQQLRNIGLKHLIMLTGDNQAVANAVAKELDIDDPKGSLLPEEKVEAIKQLRKDGQRVAMVGDGVNDAPAMANSSVGIAMGAAGSDVALETADVALMADKLSTLPFAIGLSRKTKTIIKQNLWISLGMVVILIPSTIMGLNIGPAVLAHEGSTLVVVFNALRLLGYKS